MIELASHGYIVVGIDHTYFSSGTVLPSGEHIEPAGIEFSEDMRVMDDYIREWSADAGTTMDWFEKVNQDGYVNENEEDTWLQQLRGHIDFDRVGYMGHSFGGATAGYTLAKDDRFHAGINMDGFPYGDAHLVGVEQPFLTMMSDSDLLEEYLQETDETYRKELYSRIEAISDDVISLNGALHMDFSDFPLLSPLTSWIGMTGRVSAKEQHQKINELTVDFFNTAFNDN
ncbi:prolyl oligopeptidase family serine peptidase [Bacillus sp. JCM 19041]|uniref:alpha/beta hydrolase n=1 Tax=Bacillus sp. JCM 19041 TaxID=1460637 RepID=UPI0006CFF97A